MSEPLRGSRRRQIVKLGQKAADEVILMDPAPDRQFTRSELMGLVGLDRAGEDSRTEMDFFVAFNGRLKEKSGRMYIVAGPGLVTITGKSQTVAVSEALANRAAEQALDRHIATVETVSKHLDSQGRAEAADSLARTSVLAAHIRRSNANATRVQAATDVVRGKTKVTDLPTDTRWKSDK